MGNGQIRAMQEEQYRNQHGGKDKKYNKQNLEIIQNRLQLRQDIKGIKSNSQSRTPLAQSMTFEDTQKLKVQHQLQQKVRNATPTGTQGLSNPANITGTHFTSLSKTFDISENNMENKKHTHHRNTSIMNSSADSIQLSKSKQSQQQAHNKSNNNNHDVTSNSLQVPNLKLGDRLKTAVGPQSYSQRNNLQNSMAKSHANADPFGFEDDQQDLFNQVLDSQDNFGPNSKQYQNLLEYYRKGSNPNEDHFKGRGSRTSRGNRKMSDQTSAKNLLNSNLQTQEESNSQEVGTNKNHTPTRATNKFAARMQKYMNSQAISPTSSSHEQTNSSGNGIDDSNSSSRSSRLNSNRDDLLDAESLGLGGLQFSQVPVNSFDGMENSRLSRSNGFYPGDMNDNDGSGANTGRHNSHSQTTETEEEEGVIDQGDGYKLSIMRKKRPLIVTADNEQNTDSNNAMKAAQANRNFMEFPRFDNTHNINGNNGASGNSPNFPSILEETKKDEDDETTNGSQEDGGVNSIAPRNPDATTTMYMRSKYLQKLSQNRMIDPSGAHKPKTHQTIIIWDWDDTLMSSTFLSPYQPHILRQSVRKKLPKPVQQQLDHLQELIIKLLQKSVKQGSTYIITNAGHGWVELSAARYLPVLYRELLWHSKKNGINIISARAQYEKLIPNGFKEWKFKTFHALAAKMDKDIITNIVAIGDSQIEIDAATSLQLLFKEAYVKTVKLKEQPNLVELTKQVELITSQFEEICSCAKNLTIRLQKVQDEDQNKTQQ
eukprot:403377190